MSADVFVAYYGARFDIPADSPEVEQLEAERHPLMLLAAQVELDVWWSGLPNDDETTYPVFVGKQLGLIGAEYDLAVHVSTNELQNIMHEVQTKFKNARIEQEPQLLLQVEIDS